MSKVLANHLSLISWKSTSGESALVNFHEMRQDFIPPRDFAPAGRVHLYGIWGSMSTQGMENSSCYTKFGRNNHPIHLFRVAFKISRLAFQKARVGFGKATVTFQKATVGFEKLRAKYKRTDFAQNAWHYINADPLR